MKHGSIYFWGIPVIIDNDVYLAFEMRKSVMFSTEKENTQTHLHVWTDEFIPQEPLCVKLNLNHDCIVVL